MSVNDEPAADAHAIPIVPTATLMEMYYLQLTNEKNLHCQDAIYSEIIRVINLENCYQWELTEGTVKDTAERNQSQETYNPNHQTHFTENDITVNLKYLKFKKSYLFTTFFCFLMEV